MLVSRKLAIATPAPIAIEPSDVAQAIAMHALHSLMQVALQPRCMRSELSIARDISGVLGGSVLLSSDVRPYLQALKIVGLLNEVKSGDIRLYRIAPGLEQRAQKMLEHMPVNTRDLAIPVHLTVPKKKDIVAWLKRIEQ